MTSQSENLLRPAGRDSTEYILNFMMAGILAVGALGIFAAYYLGFSPMLFVFGGGVIGALFAWVIGSFLDVKKEIKYRDHIRQETQKILKLENDKIIETHKSI